MIIEAKKSHDLPSTNERTRKANGIIQCEGEGLRIWGQQCKSQSESASLRTRSISI